METGLSLHLSDAQQKYLRENLGRPNNRKFTDLAKEAGCTREQVHEFARFFNEERKAEEAARAAAEAAKRAAEKEAFDKKKAADLAEARKLGGEALREFWNEYYAEEVTEDFDLSDYMGEASEKLRLEHWDEIYQEAVDDCVDRNRHWIEENAEKDFQEQFGEEITEAAREAAEDEIQTALNEAFEEWLRTEVTPEAA
jgi:hypothetical protein